MEVFYNTKRWNYLLRGIGFCSMVVIQDFIRLLTGYCATQLNTNPSLEFTLHLVNSCDNYSYLKSNLIT